VVEGKEENCTRSFARGKKESSGKGEKLASIKEAVPIIHYEERGEELKKGKVPRKGGRMEEGSRRALEEGNYLKGGKGGEW